MGHVISYDGDAEKCSIKFYRIFTEKKGEILEFK